MADERLANLDMDIWIEKWQGKEEGRERGKEERTTNRRCVWDSRKGIKVE